MNPVGLSTSASAPALAVEVSESTFVAARRPIAGYSAVDTFEGRSARSPLTPATNAWMDGVEDTGLPLADRLTRLLATPIILPVVVVLDTILLPFTAISNLFKS